MTQPKMNSRLAKVGVDLPNHRAVLYFHSPSTAGQELTGAASAAAAHRLRLLCLKRPSVVCDDPQMFIAAVASDVTDVVEAFALDRVDLLGWSGGAP